MGKRFKDMAIKADGEVYKIVNKLLKKYRSLKSRKKKSKKTRSQITRVITKLRAFSSLRKRDSDLDNLFKYNTKKGRSRYITMGKTQGCYDNAIKFVGASKRCSQLSYANKIKIANAASKHRGNTSAFVSSLKGIPKAYKCVNALTNSRGDVLSCNLHRKSSIYNMDSRLASRQKRKARALERYAKKKSFESVDAYILDRDTRRASIKAAKKAARDEIRASKPKKIFKSTKVRARKRTATSEASTTVPKVPGTDTNILTVNIPEGSI